MKSPDRVLGDIRTRYGSQWRDWLYDEPAGPLSWSLGVPSADMVFRDPAAVDSWLRTWHKWAAEHPDVTLRRKRLRTRTGEEQIVTHLDIPSPDALAALDDNLARHWATAKGRVTRLSTIGVMPHHVKPWLGQLVDLDETDFNILVAAVDWFRLNPNSGYLIRQVPVVGMHTKWLAGHRALLLALRAVQVEEHPDDEGEYLSDTDLDSLGLRVVPRPIDIILADPADQHRLGGLCHIQAPPAEVAALPLAPIHVLIVENKGAALAVPEVGGLVVIHSLGNNLTALETLPWLAGAKLLYWGDLDRQGLTLLSRARDILPGLTSVLMDRDTLDTYMHLAVPENEKADPPRPNLSTAEASILNILRTWHKGGYPRLEQERLDPVFVAEKLLLAIVQDEPAVASLRRSWGFR